MDDRSYICILAGGTGERFWPVSRKARPKHLVTLFGPDTLLEQAVRRAQAVVPKERIFVLTNDDQIDEARRILPFLGPDQIVAEPEKRDTAPACALATALARSLNPQAVLAVAPADALIHDGETYARQLREALEVAAAGDAFVTLAVHPIYPATGFGYLEMGDDVHAGTKGFHPVRRFVEKPDEVKAREYLATGRYGWNAGIFAWSVDYFLQEAGRLAPELAEFVKGFPKPGGDREVYLSRRFPFLPKISVDYALMEKASRVLTTWARFDWDDVGAWTALPAHFGRNGDGNTLQGKALVLDGDNNIVISTGRTIALYGASDLIVVETPDAILVCPRSKAQGVKKLQDFLPDGVK